MQNSQVGHVDFMLFVLISFALVIPNGNPVCSGIWAFENISLNTVKCSISSLPVDPMLFIVIQYVNSYCYAQRNAVCQVKEQNT